MSQWNNIFKKDADVSEEELLQYLNQELSEAEMQAIEEKMADSAFHQDALEGLAQINNKSSIQSITNSLNQQLSKQISRRSKRTKKRPIQDQQWLIVVVLSVLILSIVGYLLIHFYR